MSRSPDVLACVDYASGTELGGQVDIARIPLLPRRPPLSTGPIRQISALLSFQRDPMFFLGELRSFPLT